MKSYYLAKLTQRGKRQRHRTEVCTPARMVSSKLEEKYSREAVVRGSEATNKFKAPEVNAYKIYKYKNTFFNADRHKQPIGRSTYGR